LWSPEQKQAMGNLNITSFLGPLIISALVSCVVTGIIVKFGRKLKIMDDPSSHKHPKVVHTKAVPRGGGIPIFIALLAGSLLFFPGINIRILAVLIGAGMLAIIGFLDDRFEEKISPYWRLGINIMAALVIIAAGIGIPYITNPLGGVIFLDQPQLCVGSHCIWLLADILALVWLVGMQNIVGWSSGVDGQMPGFVIIAASVMGIMSLQFGTDLNQIPAVILAGLTAGAFLGFLPWNWYPQKIIPGYGGKSLAGFLLGILAIVSGAKVGAMILVLGIPVIDAVLVIIKRIRLGKSPVWGGPDHLHHSLLKIGWGKRRIALFYWVISAILALFALNLNSESKYFTMAAVVLGFGGIILWLQNWSISQKQLDRDSG
jgi:UDP-GlcNAc:undecaprenyl-phosphate/decaprenyl-phosphate GlcNAc-1-phosphate transferase